MSRTISVFGLGYVGSVTAACLANLGNQVIGVDVNPAKVEMLGSGRSPILEKGLAELVAEGCKDCRLHATTNSTEAVLQSETSMVCVGTPSLRNGGLDLRFVEHVCQEVGDALRRKDAFHLVVMRSTVLPGTTESVVIPLLERVSGKRSGAGFGVCYNPEFMREGSAVSDFFEPPVTVLGGADPSHLTLLRELYDWVPGKVFTTSLTTAEMVKYVCNAFHALKVGFANEVGTLCKRLSVDTQAVIEIFTADTRLNLSAAYLMPGFAFGGSCLPKDLRALTHCAKESDLRLPLLEAVLPSNAEHIDRAAEAVLRTEKRKIGILGLSFKAGTDDLRESPLVQLIKRLLGEGCQIKIWDPDVSLGRLTGSNRQFIEEVIPHIGSLLCSDLRGVVETSEVVLIGTRAAEHEIVSSWLRSGQIVIDLVNLEKSRRLDGHSGYEGICW
jgi:GDP-mannose 6-dehydrogenase